MVSRSYVFPVLCLLFLSALSFSIARVVSQGDENASKSDQVIEPMKYFYKKDPFHKKDFLHTKNPFHKFPPIKKYPLPPIPVVVIKKHPLPPISIPFIKKKPHPFPIMEKKPFIIPTIPKFDVPKPVYVYSPIPKFDIPKIKKPCPPIYKKPLFPPYASVP